MGVLLLFVLIAAIPRSVLSQSVGGNEKSGLHADGQSRAATPTHAFPNVDAVIEQAISDGQIPGAVLIVGHDGTVIYRKAYGSRALEPRREAMTLDTVFDLASLTKVIVTTTAVMQLVERGEVRLNDPVAKYLPEFAQNGKDDITVRQLLTHYSGLEPDLDLKTAWEGKETAHGMAFA
jgi:CubicO group peptidase (beta-lactamase class C family)